MSPHKPSTEPSPAWWVVCGEWVAGPWATRDRAVRELEAIVSFGACHHFHYVDSTPSVHRKPEYDPQQVRISA